MCYNSKLQLNSPKYLFIGIKKLCCENIKLMYTFLPQYVLGNLSIVSFLKSVHSLCEISIDDWGFFWNHYVCKAKSNVLIWKEWGYKPVKSNTSKYIFITICYLQDRWGSCLLFAQSWTNPSLPTKNSFFYTDMAFALFCLVKGLQASGRWREFHSTI